MVHCLREAMARRPFTPHWTHRWWRMPGELLWSAPLDGVRWEVDLAWVNARKWGLTPHRDGILMSDALVWVLDVKELTGETSLLRPIYKPLKENLQQRAWGIGLNEADR